MSEQDLFEEIWSIKRIVFGVLGVGLVGGGIVYGAHVLGFSFLNDSSGKSGLEPKKTSVQAKTVLGTKTEEEITPTPSPSQSYFSLPTKELVEQKLEEVKKQVGTLSITEIASSSPQIQKVLQDLKSLEEYPHNQVKETCLKLCGSL